MRNVDFQIVHVQTPAVERAYLTRNAQVDNEQRQAATIQRQDANEKMSEAQETEQTPETKIQLEKEKERQRRRKRKKKDHEDHKVSEKNDRTGLSRNIIDVRA